MIKFFIKKRVLVFFILLGLFYIGAVSPIQSAIAANGSQYEYTLLAPLPGLSPNCDFTNTTEKVPCKTNLETYFPKLFIFLIGLSAVFVVINIVAGGFQYMSTDAFQGKEEGRKRMGRAIGALVLVLASWLILRTINPNLTTINLNIDPLLGKDNERFGAGGTLTATSTISKACPDCSALKQNLPVRLTVQNQARLDCPTCRPMQGGIPTGGNMYDNVTPEMNEALIAMKRSLGGGGQDISWRVTEAFPPVVNHQNQCHYDATCVDVAISGAAPGHINTMITSAKFDGKFRLVQYEVSTQARLEDLVRMGVPRGNLLVVQGINGEHFSLYR